MAATADSAPSLADLLRDPSSRPAIFLRIHVDHPRGAVAQHHQRRLRAVLRAPAGRRQVAQLMRKKTMRLPPSLEVHALLRRQPPEPLPPLLGAHDRLSPTLNFNRR